MLGGGGDLLPSLCLFVEKVTDFISVINILTIDFDIILNYLYKIAYRRWQSPEGGRDLLPGLCLLVEKVCCLLPLPVPWLSQQLAY